MKRYRPNGRVLTLMLALALFNFLFLGTEYQFDSMMALVTEPKRVVTAQGYVLGSSALGCFLFPVAASYINIKEKIRRFFGFTGALTGVTCIFVIWKHGSYGAILVAGFLYFILTGMAGSAVNYYLFREVPGEHLAKTAGVLFDSLEQRYGNILMYCVTVLSVLCIVVLENGGPFLVGMVVFYLSAGFFVVFFTVSFMRLSPQMKCPKLWPGLGRAVNNICAFFTGFLFVRLIRPEDQMLRDSLLLILLVLISIVFFVYSNALCGRKREKTGSRETQPGEKESMELFAAAFSLTEREKEVLEVLLVSDENVQNIAETLMISRAALYRHIASINEKTGTRSRIGLIQFYYQYHRRNEE